MSCPNPRCDGHEWCPNCQDNVCVEAIYAPGKKLEEMVWLESHCLNCGNITSKPIF